MPWIHAMNTRTWLIETSDTNYIFQEKIQMIACLGWTWTDLITVFWLYPFIYVFIWLKFIVQPQSKDLVWPNNSSDLVLNMFVTMQSVHTHIHLSHSWHNRAPGLVDRLYLVLFGTTLNFSARRDAIRDEKQLNCTDPEQRELWQT